jgi:hypothetical protein
LVRAAHFQRYDALVIHFDLDATYNQNESLASNQRISEILSDIEKTVSTLRDIGRPIAIKRVLMTPAQSTDAWLMWGNHDGDGRTWERTARDWLKQQLYGTPPRGLEAKSSAHVQNLLARLQTSEVAPPTLQAFLDALSVASR